VLGLVIFGTSFSKYQVIGPIYLHDFVLLILTASIIINPPRILPFTPVVIILVISFIYFMISLFLKRTPVELIVRQYALFGYMGCYYLIFSKTLGTPLQSYKSFIFFVGMLSVFIQLVYVIYLVTNDVPILEEYHYFTPAIVLGIIICGASILAFIKSVSLKLMLFFLVLALSTSTGHSSAALSLLVSLGLYFLFGVSKKSKLLVATGCMVGLLLLYLLLPQFQDNNASFRLIAWSSALKRIFVENFGIIGEGFGIPYFDRPLILELYDSLGSVGFFGVDRVNEGYLSSVHNSFLTIFLSVGFVPGILIFLPFKRLFIYIKNAAAIRTPDDDFIFLSLIGISVWCSFNEILELPHSAGLFWFVYFSSLSMTVQPKMETSVIHTTSSI
jgi:hypothetical protein